MRFNIHFSKALVLAGLLMLVAIFTFNKIVQQNRLDIFQKYSRLQLPPDYEIKQNTAGTSNHRTDVRLVFQFDKQNFDVFLYQNKIAVKASPNQSNWQTNGAGLSRKLHIDHQTTVLETVYPAKQRLAFRYTQK